MASTASTARTSSGSAAACPWSLIQDWRDSGARAGWTKRVNGVGGRTSPTSRTGMIQSSLVMSNSVSGFDVSPPVPACRPWCGAGVAGTGTFTAARRKEGEGPSTGGVKSEGQCCRVVEVGQALPQSRVEQDARQLTVETLQLTLASRLFLRKGVVHSAGFEEGRSSFHFSPFVIATGQFVPNRQIFHK